MCNIGILGPDMQNLFDGFVVPQKCYLLCGIMVQFSSCLRKNGLLFSDMCGIMGPNVESFKNHFFMICLNSEFTVGFS